MRVATYRAGGARHYGMVTDTGLIALDQEFPHWPSLREVTPS